MYSFFVPIVLQTYPGRLRESRHLLRLCTWCIGAPIHLLVLGYALPGERRIAFMSQHFVASNETTSEQNQGKRSRRLFLRSSAVRAGLVVPPSRPGACSTPHTTSKPPTPTNSHQHTTRQHITSAHQVRYP